MRHEEYEKDESTTHITVWEWIQFAFTGLKLLESLCRIVHVLNPTFTIGGNGLHTEPDTRFEHNAIHREEEE